MECAIIPRSEFSNPHSNAGCGMSENELKRRTKNFALRIIELVDDLPKGRAAEVICRQLFRSGRSVGANYRAARRAKSMADFIAKMGTVEEEADESIHWMEMLTEASILPLARLQPFMAAADELVAITVSLINVAKAREK